jgi:glycosyltransferase involved in cell wall biosynthesis
MRILFCSEQPPIPPLDDGIRIPLHAVIAHLERRHEVRVLALARPEEEREAGSRSELRVVRRPHAGRLRDSLLLVRAELTGEPLRADVLAGSMRPALREEVNTFAPDVVHVATGQIAGVRDAIPDRPAVLAAQDAWHRNVEAAAQAATGLRRLVYRREVGRVRAFEQRQYARYEAVTVVSEEDAEALRSLDTVLPLHVIPNGVDTDVFGPDPRTHVVPQRIVFHGRLDYPPNVTCARVLAKEIFPLVQAEVPGASLVLVGRSPVPAVLGLDLPDRGVRVVADVDDVRPFLREASVYAAPMTTGTGIKNKVLEAMACAVPCVGTPRAFQGLSAVDGRDLVVSEEAGELASRLVELLRNPERAREIGLRGRRYVVGQHGWSAVASRFEALYSSVVGVA